MLGGCTAKASGAPVGNVGSLTGVRGHGGVGRRGTLNHRVTESARVEETFEIIELNLSPNPTLSPRVWH